MIAGAYLADIVKGNVWLFLVAAILFTIRPTIAYFKD
jgi:hypothetical protein